MWERPCQLPLIREIVGRLKNYEINCGKIVGKPGREILCFLVFFGGLGLPRRAFWFCRRRRRRDLYIPQTSGAPTSSHEQTNIYIYTDISFFMRLYLVEIYMRTERIKTFKNTTCSTCRRTCPTYLVRSISCISILMLHISISSVTGLISKKTSGRILVLHLHNHRRHSFHRQVWFLDLLSQSLRPLYLTF